MWHQDLFSKKYIILPVVLCHYLCQYSAAVKVRTETTLNDCEICNSSSLAALPRGKYDFKKKKEPVDNESWFFVKDCVGLGTDSNTLAPKFAKVYSKVSDSERDTPFNLSFVESQLDTNISPDAVLIDQYQIDRNSVNRESDKGYSTNGIKFIDTSSTSSEARGSSSFDLRTPPTGNASIFYHGDFDSDLFAETFASYSSESNNVDKRKQNVLDAMKHMKNNGSNNSIVKLFKGRDSISNTKSKSSSDKNHGVSKKSGSSVLESNQKHHKYRGNMLSRRDGGKSTCK